MTVETLLEEIRTLSPVDRQRLVKAILKDQDSQPAPKTRSILEFEGVGAEMWNGIEEWDYMNQLREEWNEL